MDDLARVLTKFHREIVAPDVERIVSASEGRLRDEMNGRFDALYQRFERLELLRGDLAGHHSIRVNDQWRVVFRWTASGPLDVDVRDYH